MPPRETDRSGLLVAVCGIDGSGKTVQVEKLCARAEEEGLTTRSMEFPRYGEGFFADLVERYLRGDFGGDPSDVSPYLAALPYAGDRWEAAETLRGWLRDGGLVVCNRYVPANIAHQGSKLDSEAELEDYCRWVRRLEYDVYGVPRPDLHLWLDMPPAAAGGLARGRSDEERPAGGEDIHEGDLDYLRQTRNVYRWLAERNDDWGRIECARDGEADSVSLISERIWNTLKNRLLAAE